MDKSDDVAQAFAKSMNLRDFFAGLVLSGMVSNKGQMSGKFSEDMQTTAEYCYRCADAMLRARDGQHHHSIPEPVHRL